VVFSKIAITKKGGFTMDYTKLTLKEINELLKDIEVAKKALIVLKKEKK